METIKTLVADDETEARRGLRKLLEDVPEIEVVGVCSDGHKAVAALRELRPELLFLDVQMPDLNGFEVLRAAPVEPLPVVVFVTAYDRYALEAFQVHAVDYLLKPFTNRRFQEAVERAKERVRRRNVKALNERLSRLMDHLEKERPEPSAPKDSYLRRVGVPQRDRVRLLEMEDVEWIEASSNYARLHTGEHSYLLRTTLHDLEGQLDPERFVRIHRSYIVNVDRVQTLQSLGWGDAVLVLKDGTELRSSRSYRKRRQQLFGT